MAKLNNKGFSLIELIIAITVFVMMIVPIISQLMTSMNINTRSRTLQEDSEYAQYIMEYFKSTPLDEIGQDNLFDGSNAIVLKQAETTKSVVVNGTVVEYAEIIYEIPKTSAVTIGKGTYYSEITLDTKEYALTQAGYRSATDAEIADSAVAKVSGSDGGTYVAIDAMQDPNQTNVGTLTNLDSSLVAIIAGSASNCDISASDAIFSMKADALKSDGDLGYAAWEQLMYGNYSGFERDTVKKVTRISVIKDDTGSQTEYTVKVLVDYKDSNTSYPTTLPTYNVWQNTFVQDEPPVIYYMYNPCVYNAEYMADDYVVLDTSKAGGAEIKMYLIETAAEISTNIQEIMDANGISYASTNLIEEVDTSGTRVERDEIITHFNLGVETSDQSDYSNIKVYTNKTLSRIDDYDVITNILTSYPTNVAPATNYAVSGEHFVKTLADDVDYEGRLYTMTVTLYDASDDSSVATYTGTRGYN